MEKIDLVIPSVHLDLSFDEPLFDEEDTTMNKLRILSEDIVLGAAQIVPVDGVQKKYQPFLALVTFAGVPSDRYVGGTEAVEGGPYKVFLPVPTLRQNITELEGKQVFAAPNLTDHKHSVSIGEFVSAWVEPVDMPDGRLLLAAKASGFFERERSPELVDKIVSLAREKRLGFSYDMKEVAVQLKASSVSGESESFLEVTNFKWRGATVLLKDAAAYSCTQLAASKAEASKQNEETSPESEPIIDNTEVENEMDSKEILQSIESGIAAAFQKFQKDVIDPLRESITVVVDRLSAMETKTTELSASVADTKATQLTLEAKSNEVEDIPVEAFMKTLTEGFTTSLQAAISPLATAITELKTNLEKKPEEKPPVGERRSVKPAELTLMARFTDKAEEDMTVEDYSQLIHKVGNDSSLREQDKDRMLSYLGASKRDLIRAARSAN